MWRQASSLKMFVAMLQPILFQCPVFIPVWWVVPGPCPPPTPVALARPSALPLLSFSQRRMQAGGTSSGPEPPTPPPPPEPPTPPTNQREVWPVPMTGAQLLLTRLFTQFPDGDALVSERLLAVRTLIDRFLLLPELEGRLQGTWHVFINAAYPELRGDDLSRQLLRIVARCFCIREQMPCDRLYDFVEFFCGQGNLSAALLHLGLFGASMDKCHDPMHDVTTAAGLRLWIDVLSQTKVGSLNWHGTQCSSWVSLCRCQSNRKLENQYLGDCSRVFVRIGNLQMEISSLLILLSHLVSNIFVLEQPLGSVMPLAQPMKCTLAFTGADKHVTWHGAFGGASPKPLQLWSTNPGFKAMQRKKPTKKNGKLTKQTGKSFTGNKAALKQSQVYSHEFGLAVGNILLSGR